MIAFRTVDTHVWLHMDRIDNMFGRDVPRFIMSLAGPTILGEIKSEDIEPLLVQAKSEIGCDCELVEVDIKVTRTISSNKVKENGACLYNKKGTNPLFNNEKIYWYKINWGSNQVTIMDSLTSDDGNGHVVGDCDYKSFKEEFTTIG